MAGLLPLRSRAADRAWRWFLLGGMALVVVRNAVVRTTGADGAGDLVYVLVNLAVVGAVVAGLRAGHPASRGAWWLILASVTIQATLNVVDAVEPAGVPAIAVEAMYLAPYALTAGALVLLVRRHRSGASWAALLDSTVVTLGFGLSGLLALHAVLSEGRGLGDPVFLAGFFVTLPSLVLVLWLASTAGPARTVAALLLTGLVAQAAGDAIFSLELALGDLPVEPESDWLASLVCLGAAALHPAVRETGQPALVSERTRVGLLVGSILAPVTLDAVQHLDQTSADPDGAIVDVALVVVAFAAVRIVTLYRTLGAEREREATARLLAEELIETSPGVVVRGPVGDDTLTFASRKLEEVLGYRSEDVVDRPGWWTSIVHPDDLGAFPRTIEDAARMDRGLTGEVRMRHADGTYRTILLAAEWLRGADGRPVEFVGTGLDLTALRTTQEELGRAHGYLDEIAQSTPVVLIHGHGPALTLDYVSPSVRTVLGYPPETVVGVPRWIVDIIEPGEREATHAAFMASVAAKETWYHRDVCFVHADGSVRTFDVVLRREFGVGDAWSFSGTMIDITERLAVEHDLRVARDEAYQANRAKSEFLSGVSHELRTPLNAILGFGQLLERAQLPAEEDRDSVAHVLRGGRQLLEMVDELLDLARVDAGRLTMSIEPVLLDAVIRDARDLILPAADARSIPIVPPEPEPGAWVLADVRRLRQVLLNLLSNAVRVSPDGAAVRIVRRTGTAEGRWRIEVADGGPGIDPARLPALFTLGRKDGAPGAEPGGLGVGLPLSARLVEAMAGSIGVDTEPGHGSTFWFELPATTAPDAATQVATTSATEGDRRTIVYIEDNLSNIGLVERLFAARPDARLLTAMQGRLGLELVRQHHADLVLLDLHLPDIDGEEVIGALRDDPTTAAIPILVLSSSLEPGLRRRLRNRGASAFLVKPLDVDEFLTTVNRLLNGAQPPEVPA